MDRSFRLWHRGIWANQPHEALGEGASDSAGPEVVGPPRCGELPAAWTAEILGSGRAADGYDKVFPTETSSSVVPYRHQEWAMATWDSC
jgi:hypothetical protein